MKNYILAAALSMTMPITASAFWGNPALEVSDKDKAVGLMVHIEESLRVAPPNSCEGYRQTVLDSFELDDLDYEKTVESGIAAAPFIQIVSAGGRCTITSLERQVLVAAQRKLAADMEAANTKAAALLPEFEMAFGDVTMAELGDYFLDYVKGTYKSRNQALGFALRNAAGGPNSYDVGKNVNIIHANFNEAMDGVIEVQRARKAHKAELARKNEAAEVAARAKEAKEALHAAARAAESKRVDDEYQAVKQVAADKRAAIKADKVRVLALNMAAYNKMKASYDHMWEVCHVKVMPGNVRDTYTKARQWFEGVTANVAVGIFARPKSAAVVMDFINKGTAACDEAATI